MTTTSTPIIIIVIRARSPSLELIDVRRSSWRRPSGRAMRARSRPTDWPPPPSVQSNGPSISAGQIWIRLSSARLDGPFGNGNGNAPLASSAGQIGIEFEAHNDCERL
jgi:hypothetical protein